MNEEDVNLMNKFDELHLRHPFKGSRRLRDDHGLRVNRKRVQRLMRLMGIRALYRAPERPALIGNTGSTPICFEIWRLIE